METGIRLIPKRLTYPTKDSITAVQFNSTFLEIERNANKLNRLFYRDKTINVAAFLKLFGIKDLPDVAMYYGWSLADIDKLIHVEAKYAPDANGLPYILITYFPEPTNNF